jgi:hypothetical protein
LKKLPNNFAQKKLVERLTLLFKSPQPYILSGVHDWQINFYPHPKTPPIDVFWGGLYFSFLKPHRTPSFLRLSLFGLEVTPPTRILEQAFRERLLKGTDLTPAIPIYVDPKLIVKLEPALFAAYLDEQWQEAISWALKQLPPMDTGQFDVLI